MKFVAIDFETANSKRSSACALGLVVVEQGIIKEKRYWLIKPSELYFDPFNVYIHGITEEDVRNEPEFPEVWAQAKAYLDGNLVFAHNASFDMSVLRYVFNEYGITYPELTYSCTRLLAKKTWPGLINYKLSTIAEYLGIVFQHHNAVEDARACGEIAIKAFHNLSCGTIDDINEEFSIKSGRLFPGGYLPAGEKGGSSNPCNLVAATTEFDVNHHFYRKTIVFTGTLKSLARKDAMQRVVNVGGSCANNVTQETNYLVVGIYDYSRLRNGNKSSKLTKAEALIAKGFNLEIITEHEFLELL